MKKLFSKSRVKTVITILMVLTLASVVFPVALVTGLVGEGTRVGSSTISVSEMALEKSSITGRAPSTNEFGVVTVSAIFSLVLLSGIIFVLLSAAERRRKPDLTKKLY